MTQYKFRVVFYPLKKKYLHSTEEFLSVLLKTISKEILVMTNQTWRIMEFQYLNWNQSPLIWHKKWDPKNLSAMRLHSELIHDTKCWHISVDLGATITVVAEALDKECKGKDPSLSLNIKFIIWKMNWILVFKKSNWFYTEVVKWSGGKLSWAEELVRNVRGFYELVLLG